MIRFFNILFTCSRQNVHTLYGSDSGPVGTGQDSARRLQPYGTSRAQRTEHQNAEAGPSTLARPRVPYINLPIPQPTGGTIPETTADAEINNSITEEQEAPVSNFYRSRAPRVTDCSFGVRPPTRPGDPMARAHTVQPARTHRVNTWSSATSSRGGRAMRLLPQLRKRLLVSSFLTRRSDTPDPIG